MSNNKVYGIRYSEWSDEVWDRLQHERAYAAQHLNGMIQYDDESQTIFTSAGHQHCQAAMFANSGIKGRDAQSMSAADMIIEREKRINAVGRYIVDAINAYPELSIQLADAQAEIKRLREALEGAFKLLSGPSVINNAFRLGAFGALDIEKAVTLIQQALNQQETQQ